MAKKKIPANPKQATKKLLGKLWSELKPGTRRKYKAAGVSPQKYNAARSKRGQARADYLGLRPHQISGVSTPAKQTALQRAFRRIRDVFGTYAKFNPSRVHSWLTEISVAHLTKLANASDAEIYEWAFEHDTTFATEKASKRYGPRADPAVPKSGVLSGGYLFYH